MSMIESILVPLDGSAAAARVLGCATWLAERLGAAVHVLSAGSPALPPAQALRRLRVPERDWSKVTLHHSDGPPEQSVLELVDACGIGLVAVSARGAQAEVSEEPGPLAGLGHVARWIAEHSPVPVLLVPPGYREGLPWTRALVPVSGEADADEVLSYAARLSCALGLTTTAVHVMRADDGDIGLAAEARYADEPHHEYPARLQRLVERGLPGCSAREAACIEDVVLRRGDVAEQLLALMSDRSVDVLIVGWHGTLLAGHAGVLRTLLRRVRCPLLLVKPAPPAAFKLKVGDEIE